MLARLTVAPALLVVAWLAVSLPLLLAGMFRLGPALALFVPVAIVVLRLGFLDRRDPRTASRGRVSWWSVGGVAGVSAAFLVLQLVMCSEQVIVRRDAASYLQFATWLVDHGTLPVDPMRWAFGGGDPALEYGGAAFYQHGGDVVPQFMAGMPMVLAMGGWIGGTGAMLAIAPLLGAAAVLSFGGLTARLVGPRWAPLGALALALTMPMQWVSRSTYSELPALVLLLGALALLYDVRELDSGTARVRAFLAGLALGLIVLVRIDGIRDLLPVVVFAGLLAARRRPTAVPLALGLGLGAAAGLAEGYLLSRPYLDYLRDSLVPALLLAGATAAATALMAAVLRRRATGDPLRRLGRAVSRGPLPSLAAALPVLVLAAFAVRPHLQTVRRAPRTADDGVNVRFIEEVQRINHLAVDGLRQYSEQSLYWVIWYVGVPAVLLAGFGAALLTRRLLRRRSGAWALPFMMIAWTTVSTLLRPGITPDQPWASRRLISLVIPGMLLLALWGLAWLVRAARRTGFGRRFTGAAAVAGALALLVPIGLVSWPLALRPLEQGELAAARGLCDRLGPGRSVVVVDPDTADRFVPLVRSMCGVPAARLREGAGEPDVRRIIQRIERVRRRPVVLGATPADVVAYGRPEQAVRLRTKQDQRTLTGPPTGAWTLNIDVWMAAPLG